MLTKQKEKPKRTTRQSWLLIMKKIQAQFCNGHL